MPPKRRLRTPLTRAPKRTRLGWPFASNSEAEAEEEEQPRVAPRATAKVANNLPNEEGAGQEDELAYACKSVPRTTRRKRIVTYGASARAAKRKSAVAVPNPQEDELEDELAAATSPTVARDVRKGPRATVAVAKTAAPTTSTAKAATTKALTTNAATTKASATKTRAAKETPKEREAEDVVEEEEEKAETRQTTAKTPRAPRAKAAPAKRAATASTRRTRAKAVETIETTEAEAKAEYKGNQRSTTDTSESVSAKAIPAKTPRTNTRAKKVAVVEEEEEEEGEEEEEEEEEEEGEKKGVTPRTVVKMTKPPRTERKKGTSSAPRTRIQAKLGVGVPAGGDEHTPTARRSRALVQPPVEEHQVDEDEDVVLPNGKIAPARPATGGKKRPSAARPSLGTEGLEDPFAVPPKRAAAVRADTDVEVTVAPPKASSVTKRRTPTRVQETAGGPEQRGGDIVVSADAASLVRTHVLNKIMGRERLNLVGVDEEYSNVHHLLEQTIAAGEGNSMLVIGSRGSGKTTLVETAIASLASTHTGEFHVVRLNGLLQTDDKLALREIWRQLGVEMELEGDGQPKTTNFADTLQSILAVLSHPDELQAPAEECGPDADEDAARTAVAVVFVLDEFDRFATHPRQTLLYNLFDIAQAKKAPIAVLGLTCKVDVADSLEKRVKSRFSHRTVHLKLPASLDAFWDIVREGLVVDAETATLHGRETERYAEAWNQFIDVTLPHAPSLLAEHPPLMRRRTCGERKNSAVSCATYTPRRRRWRRSSTQRCWRCRRCRRRRRSRRQQPLRGRSPRRRRTCHNCRHCRTCSWRSSSPPRAWRCSRTRRRSTSRWCTTST